MDYEAIKKKVRDKFQSVYQNSYVLYEHEGLYQQHNNTPEDISIMLSLGGEPMDYSKAKDLFWGNSEYMMGHSFIDWLKEWNVKPTFKPRTVVVRGKVFTNVVV